MSVELLPRNNYRDLYKVATVDATNKEKNEAQVVLDGVNDQTKINELILNLQSSRGGTVAVGAGQLYVSDFIIADGKGSTSTPSVNIIGMGNQSTIINCTSNAGGILVRNAYNGTVKGFGINVDGTGTGFEIKGGDENGNFIGVGIRGCYNATFEDVTVKGASTHTGTGFKFGNFFRSTFRNLESFNVKNGMRLYAQSDLFNPGDSVFDRLFMEIQGGAGAYAYLIDSDVPNTSTTFVGQINQCKFDVVQAFTQNDGAVGIKLDGQWAVQNNTFDKISLREFQTVIDNINSSSNKFNFDYCSVWTGATPLPNQKMIKSGVNATNNIYNGGNAYIDQTMTLVEDNSSSIATRNIYERLAYDLGPNAIVSYSGTANTQIIQSMVKNTNGGTLDPILTASL